MFANSTLPQNKVVTYSYIPGSAVKENDFILNKKGGFLNITPAQEIPTAMCYQERRQNMGWPKENDVANDVANKTQFCNLTAHQQP